MGRSLKHIRFLVAIVAVAQAVFAQSGERSKRVLCWEISSDRGKAFILGSVHAAREDLYPLDPVIEQAFAESDRLVVEVDISQANQGAMQMGLLVKGAYPAGDSLSANLSSEDLAQVRSFVEARGIEFATFDRIKPWLVALMLTVSELQRAGLRAENGIDMHFLKQAHAQGKTVQALESAEFQINLLSGFSDELQRLFLVSTIREMDKLMGMVDEATDAWKRGDAETIDRMLLQSQREDERMRPVFQRLISDRNVSMAARVRELLNPEITLFVVVGAGHVVGAGGLVEIFSAEEGFEVRQMQPSAVTALR